MERLLVINAAVDSANDRYDSLSDDDDNFRDDKSDGLPSITTWRRNIYIRQWRWRWRWTGFLFFGIVGAVFTALLAAHAFSAPNTVSATCAAALADGPCAASGGAACTIRCPPRCSDAWLSATVYTVYGGGANNSYSGESKLCRAAIHSGVLSASGGCAVVRIGPGKASFLGGASGGGGRRVDVKSFDADYFFPYSLTFESSTPSLNCASLQWPLLAWVALASCAGFALALKPAAPLAAAWAAMAVMGYWYLVFTARGSDPFSSLSVGAASFVSLSPLLACVWMAAARKSMGEGEGEGEGERGVDAAFPAAQRDDHTIAPTPTTTTTTRPSAVTIAFFYVIPFLASMHMNLATAIVPDVSLDADALKQGPGALVLFLFIIFATLATIFYGLYFVFMRGPIARRAAVATLLCYVFGSTVLIGISVSTSKHTSPHVHHSLLALALLPLTGSSTARPMLVVQAILLGVLINGVAFWGIGGPWDLVPLASAVGPACTPFLANTTATSARVDWACSPPPQGTSFALAVNGAIVFNGFNPPAQLNNLPIGYGGTMRLFFLFLDGSYSMGSDVVPFHTS